jgi:LPS-assembly protein
MCGYRKSDKCPPWELNASKMTHDKKKKTIFYDNALIKIYNIPIFYLPKLAHPDPTVDRRSGFLNPSYSDTKNLGSSINLPYFWAIGGDKDLTINNRLFATEHPLFIGEYRQKFKNSNLNTEFGFTEGYKSHSKNKKQGNKNHFFSKFVKTFEMNNGTFNNLEINLQHVTNKKYLKLYKIESNLINYETETLENYINFDSINDEKSFLLSLNATNFRSISDVYNDKQEFILPEISINKFLFTEQLGHGNLNTNLKIHNYDTNKYKKFLINNFNWSYDKSFINLPYDGEFLTSFKNVNYEVKNVKGFKEDTTSEIFGAFGYLASADLFKKKNENVNHFLQPKILLRYSPNHMRSINESFNLNNKDIFTLNRVDSPSNFESGANLTYGFDYKINNKDNETKFSLGQIINEKKNNKKISDTSSLDKRFSDILGSFNYDDNKKFKINYDYSLDQNFKEMNYNEVNASYDFNNIKFNIDYLEQNNISNKVNDEKEYIKTSLEIQKGDNGLFTFSNKRNIITNSSEFYNMSYEYINDCLRAGLIFRREFYNDSELEAENSLMFKITLSPFGEMSSPSFSQ